MDEFEKMLCECRGAVERFVNFKFSSKFDADDVIQEVFIAASQNFGTLRDKSTFKAWIIGIARHKCNDYYRKKAKVMEIPLDEVPEARLTVGSMGIIETNHVRDTIENMSDKDKEILFLYFFHDLSQAEISEKLGIPVGTVKSRLYNAKLNFKEKYPYSQNLKGDLFMKKLPEIMPNYSIKDINEKPFSVKFEEMPNWFIIPKRNEKVVWASYDFQSKKKTQECVSEVTGKVFLHGIEGVEVKTVDEDKKSGKREEHFYMVQLTDSYSRWLGEKYFDDNGDMHYCTFLDGDEFIADWGFGENNCGAKVNLTAEGNIILNNGEYVVNTDKECIDIVGRYSVTINEKEYDTVIAVEYHPHGTFTQTFIDESGRTVLWRRFNRDEWRWKSNDEKKWSEVFPDNEQIIINGEVYVHWYDCITDYIL